MDGAANPSGFAAPSYRATRIALAFHLGFAMVWVKELRSLERENQQQLLGISVTVAQLTLDQLVMVQIHDPQLDRRPAATAGLLIS